MYQNPKQNSMRNITDFGPNPFVINIEMATEQNMNFRTALWTGCHLQLTLMCIEGCGEIGLEAHQNVDQFLRIEEGCGLVMMGRTKDRLDFQQKVSEGFAVFVPAGTWHNIINTSNCPLKLYTIYAPLNHPHGTVHRTKEEADAWEH